MVVWRHSGDRKDRQGGMMVDSEERNRKNISQMMWLKNWKIRKCRICEVPVLEESAIALKAIMKDFDGAGNVPWGTGKIMNIPMKGGKIAGWKWKLIRSGDGEQW